MEVGVEGASRGDRHGQECGYSGKRGFLSSLFHVSFSFLIYFFVEED